jgi:hypothetical protein
MPVRAATNKAAAASGLRGEPVVREGLFIAVVRRLERASIIPGSQQPNDRQCE